MRNGIHPGSPIQSIGLVISLLVPFARATSQAPRAVLHVKWTADSSWEGEYYQKPYRFHVHEELAGQLLFEVDDASLVPATSGASGAAAAPRTVRAIQLRDDGAASGARLVQAIGSSTYRMDVHKEGGECATTRDTATAPALEPPFDGSEETSAAWDSLSPGSLLIVLRGSEPTGVAFSPKTMWVHSSHRLLCPNPETVSRRQTYRMTAKFGSILSRVRPDSAGGAPGAWTIQSSRSARGGYTLTATYRAVVRQTTPVANDASAATGQLEVRKTFVVTWEAAQ